MTDSARRRRVDDLCDAALHLEAHKRTSFVAAACGGDEALRQEVEALLAHAHTAEGFLSAPVGAVAAHVLADERGTSLLGRHVAAYQIMAFLGAGGMGEVYKARDTKLARDVAIKILPRAFTGDPERLARFQREARLLASLNHPNIATIHGIEDIDGVSAIVMELVDGPTLAERLAKGPLPIKEALSMTTQIADALDAAHEKGIVHRDLKPANIKIAANGTVKLLDFGLAKLVTDGSSADLTQSPTVTVDSTREGLILGTAAYMSPEQARGQAVDKRTDIWAFGCVVFEALTGTAAFAAETLSETIARILERDPDWERVAAAIPAYFYRLLQRCLEKDPTERLRDIGDARFELQRPDQATQPASASMPLIATVLITGLIVGVGMRMLSQRTSTPPAGRSIASDAIADSTAVH